MGLTLQMSSEMVYSDAGVKSEKELMRCWPVAIIQAGAFKEVEDEASCW